MRPILLWQIRILGKWPLEIRYSSRRKTIGLEVRDTRVIIRAPRGYPAAALEALAEERSDWISAKVQAQRSRIALRPHYQYTQGEYLPYLGEQLQLVIQDAGARQIEQAGHQLHVTTGRRSTKPKAQQVYELVCHWYRDKALELLTHKTHQLCSRAALQCRQVTVRSTRSKWGHCTSQGDIQYNWQILLAAEPVVDYLVAHEVSHLRHPNHSPAFWQCVADLFPGYEQQRLWLRRQGHLLVLPIPE